MLADTKSGNLTLTKQYFFFLLPNGINLCSDKITWTNITGQGSRLVMVGVAQSVCFANQVITRRFSRSVLETRNSGILETIMPDFSKGNKQ